MNPLALLCKLPKWMRGGHRWSKPYDVNEGGVVKAIKVCHRCLEVRAVKRRKK